MENNENVTNQKTQQGFFHHLPFWSGTGMCYSGKEVSSSNGDPSHCQEKYYEDTLEFDMPKRETPTQAPIYAKGTPVTRNAANAMVKAFYPFIKEELIKDFHIEVDQFTDQKIFNFIEKFFPYCVFFGKEALLFVLAQPGCEGIRYYFCRNPECEPSLVFVGVDASGCDFGAGSNGSIIDKFSAQADQAGTDGNSKPGIEAARQKSTIVEVGGTDPPPGLSANDIYGE